MPHLPDEFIRGYQHFKQHYAQTPNSIMGKLSEQGQRPEIMVITCSDSRVDPALILQCDPGDLFVVRNVANIIPAYDNDKHCHGVSAALEFGICHLNVKHLIIMGHSQCGGIQALMNRDSVKDSDFIRQWVSCIEPDTPLPESVDECAQAALHQSYAHCDGFPWIQQRVHDGSLSIHRWFFNIADGSLHTYDESRDAFMPLTL